MSKLKEESRFVTNFANCYSLWPYKYIVLISISLARTKGIHVNIAALRVSWIVVEASKERLLIELANRRLLHLLRSLLLHLRRCLLTSSSHYAVHSLSRHTRTSSERESLDHGAEERAGHSATLLLPALRRARRGSSTSWR